MTDMVIQSGEWNYYRDNLTNIMDLERFQRELVMKKHSPKLFSKLHANLLTIMEIANKSRTSNEEVYVYTTRSGDPIPNGTRIIEKLEEIFNMEIASTISDVSIDYLTNISVQRLHFINPGVSHDIDSALGKYHDCLIIQNAIQQHLTSLIAKTETKSKNADYVKYSSQAKTDPYFYATTRRCNILSKNIEKLTMDDKVAKIEFLSNSGEAKNYLLHLEQITINNKNSSKTEKIITSPQIRQIMSNIQSSLDNIIRTITKFYDDLLDDMISYSDSLDIVSSYVENIDVIQNKAYIANKYNYCRPVINSESEKSFCDFTEIRHPLIEHIQTNELYVTNDLSIGKEGDDFNGLLLYGTNAVGKTSLIRSIGIAIIMAQAGLYVPCQSFTYFPYDYIFTRILGNDNLFKGLSTFAVEMCELRTILKMATKNSIILGDELCSGTESHSALSIFTSGLEFLSAKECTFLFATHFHEIVNYDEINDLNKLKMMHMEVIYDVESDCLVYNRKLQPGPGNSMYGLEVCKSLGLGDDFIKRATSIRLKYNTESEGILSQNTSRYNSKKVRTICEICQKKQGVDTHHLEFKGKADTKTGYINSFNKNHVANLASVCDKCHKIIHDENIEMRKTKTTSGSRLTVI
jgi:DNA mismatch repair protein MutS